jgi:hypothetical protein
MFIGGAGPTTVDQMSRHGASFAAGPQPAVSGELDE